MQRSLLKSSGFGEESFNQACQFLELNHSCSELLRWTGESWRWTNHIVKGGISNHIDNGTSPVLKKGIVGMIAAYAHASNGPVAKASKTTVITTPTNV